MKKYNYALRLCTAALIVVLVCFAAAACGGRKTAMTAESFAAIMRQKGFRLGDITDQYDGGVKKVYAAVPQQDTYQIEFYEMTDAGTAKYNFTRNKDRLEQQKTDSSKHTSSSGDNFNTYYRKTAGKFQYICRVDDTLVYIDAGEKYYLSIKDILDELGYGPDQGA